MTWTSGVCETSGIDIHYLRTGGAGDPVVLLHGLMGSGACWTPLARALEGEFDVVMPDARGHGDSSAPHHGYRYDDHASDVVGIIRGLELSRPVLLGHSMGGMTAAVVASRGAGSIPSASARCGTVTSPINTARPSAYRSPTSSRRPEPGTRAARPRSSRSRPRRD